MNAVEAYALNKTPIHVGRGGALPIEGFKFDRPSFEAYVQKHCTDAEPGRLMMIEESPTNWPAWECHTLDDEVVFILEGRGEFIQELDGKEVRTPVGPRSAIINPKGVWHTADIVEPISAIYLTPCLGTEHKPRKT
jgi:uncharacterized cupin superfamily protein